MNPTLIPLILPLIPLLSHAAITPMTLAPLYLEVGEQRILKFDEIEQFSLSGDCVRYWRDGKRNQILIKGVRPGLATLVVNLHGSRSSTRNIRIEPNPKSHRPPEFLKALSTLHATEVIDGGDRFVLRGEVKSRSEAHAIAHLKEQFESLIIDETTIPNAEIPRIEHQLAPLIENYPSLELIHDSGEFLIRGDVQNGVTATAIRKKALQIHPLIRVELSSVKGGDSTLYFKVFLLEVKKELMTHLGITWPSMTPAALSFNPIGLSGKNSLDLTIHTLTEKGMVRILSSPELVVKAPGQAELFAGGELPIRQKNRFNDSVSWKTFGLTLRIDVKEFGGERVKLNIETEISHLDTQLKQEEIPGLKTNRIKTLVDGTMGKPLLLSGLLQEDLQEAQSGLPGLSEIPILGRLFSSQDFQNKRSELVAILLPHRRPPESPQTRISSEIPSGFVPLPRNRMSEEEISAAKKSPHYPWNVL